jgi:hypothetical protein
MNGRSIVSALSLWLLLLVVAVIAGAFRESLLTPRFGGQVAHVVGTLVVAAIMAVIIALYIRRGPPRSLKQRWMLGVFWLALTVSFEFLFGHYVAGRPWEVLLADYNLLQGRIWVLILAVLLLTPVFGGKRAKADGP